MPGDARARSEALFREVNERIEDVSTMLEWPVTSLLRSGESAAGLITGIGGPGT
jgi:hypothetical protein